MNMMRNQNAQSFATERAGYDEGLRAYMLKIYNYMAGALAVSGGVAYVTANTPALLNMIFGTPLVWLFILAPLGMVFFFGAKLHSMSVGTAKTVFWLFAAVMGVSMASLLLAFTGASVARAFFITASIFGVMSLWGYSTKKDLTAMGSFLIMGAFGILIAMVVNWFMASAALDFAISALAVVIFTGLMAYDTQKLKHMYYQVGGGDMLEKIAIMGALTLYMDFIIVFQHLLSLFGDRR